MSIKNERIEKILSNFQAIKRALMSEGHALSKNYCMTMSQSTVLFLLKNDGAMNLSEVAGVLGISKSATTQLVDGLEKQGLVVRESDASDRRALVLKVSPKGLKYMQDIKKKSFEKVFTIFEVLDEDELEQLEQITSKLIQTKRDA